MLVRSAPSKLNLFLHITGKQENGYHLLDSLVVFTEFSDQITLTESSHFQFSCSGTYSDHIDPDRNLVTQAVQRLATHYPHITNTHIHLQKNIPIGGGLGGGSADAAATLLALNQFFALDIPIPQLHEIGLSLGADVPVCLNGTTSHMKGIGENITPINCPSLYLLLVNPNIHIPTKIIFERRIPSNIHTEHTHLPEFKDYATLIRFLKEQDNDLFDVASSLHPALNDVLKEITRQDGCNLARMSGSGATCFGIFEDKIQAENASNQIQKRHPDWFIRVTHTL
jgi:4-diphosphocytidyl-2-C-methyl-D-erythritol kinase